MAKLLRDAGLSEKGLITAIKELRKGSTVSSQTQETQFNTLKSDLGVLTKLTEFAQKNVELKQRDVERKSALVENKSGSQADLDKSTGDLVTSQLQRQLAEQRKQDALHQLLGNPDLKIQDFPAWAQAKAVLDQAKLDLKHTMLVSPINGIATQVDNIQLGDRKSTRLNSSHT